MAMDSPSFDDRFGLLAAIAYQVAFRLLGDHADAEEVAQETLARALTRWKSVASHDEAWVAHVATNLAIGRWRRRRPTIPLSEDHEATTIAAQTLSLERRMLVEALA